MTPWEADSSLSGLESGSHLQGLSLLLLDAGKTVLCALAGLCVGHAEHVVSLHSAVHARVAGDGLAQHQALGLGADAVEGGDGLVSGLVAIIGNGVIGCGLGSWVVNLGVFATEESVHGRWGNWSRVAGLSTVDANDVGDGLVLNGSVVNELLLHHGGVFKVSRLITALVESVSLRGKGSHTVGLAELHFRLNAGNVTGIAGNLLLSGGALLVLIGLLNSSLVASVAGDLTLLGLEHSLTLLSRPGGVVSCKPTNQQ